jgi:hypothetical protein
MNPMQISGKNRQLLQVVVVNMVSTMGKKLKLTPRYRPKADGVP